MKKIKILKTSFIYGTKVPLVIEGDIYFTEKINKRFAYIRHKTFNSEVRLSINKDCVIL